MKSAIILPCIFTYLLKRCVLLLLIVHLFASRGAAKTDLDARIDAVEAAQRDTKERVDVVEARTEAVESTIKHELTERRDALVTEMKQLETLIDRLSHSFESKLETAGSVGEVAPQDDAILRAVKDALTT